MPITSVAARARTRTAAEEREREREGAIEGGEDATSVVDGRFLYGCPSFTNTYFFSSFKIVFQARLKAPKTNQVRAEIYCDLNTGSCITHISGEERPGIGSCRCAILVGDVLMCN